MEKEVNLKIYIDTSDLDLANKKLKKSIKRVKKLIKLKEKVSEIKVSIDEVEDDEGRKLQLLKLLMQKCIKQ